MNFFAITRKLLFISLIIAVAQTSAVTERTYAQKARNDFKACGVLTATTLGMDCLNPSLQKLSRAKFYQEIEAWRGFYDELLKKHLGSGSNRLNRQEVAKRLAKKLAKENSFFFKYESTGGLTKAAKSYILARFSKAGLKHAASYAIARTAGAAENLTSTGPKIIGAILAASLGIKAALNYGLSKLEKKQV